MNSLVYNSIARHHYLATATSIGTAIERPTIAMQGTTHIAQVGVGTFNPPRKSFFLVVDTGSDLIWTQCEGCLPDHCFPQKTPTFPS